MSLLADAYSNMVTLLEDAGVPVTTDPRNVAPPCTVLEPPTVVFATADVVELRFQIVICQAPPGNANTITQLLDTADLILNAIPTDSAAPGSVRYGGQELSAYLFTTTMTFQRSS